VLVLRMLILPLMLCICVAMASAGTFYKWKDASGIVHFTDDLSKVPMEYRANSAKDMKPLAVVSKEPEKLKAQKGKALYEQKCEACHVIDYGDKDGRESLAWAIIDRSTNYPHTRDDLFKRLRRVVDGSIDMPVVDIKDDELMAVVDYLIEKSHP